MVFGQRLTYESLYDLPYMFFVLMRSSKSVSFTLGAFVMGKLFKTTHPISQIDILLTSIITFGLILFNIADVNFEIDLAG